MQSGERTGTSTLFTALARSKNMPTMKIITLNKEWVRKVDKGEDIDTAGHYFVACYIQNISGKSDWVLVDSDRTVQGIRDVRLGYLDKENRNIEKDFYSFAYVRDYGDVSLNNRRID